MKKGFHEVPFVPYLNKFNLKVKLPFLYEIYRDMLFQFDKLELKGLRREAEYQLLRSMAALTGDKMIEFEAGILKAKIDEYSKNIPENEGN